MDMWIQTLNLCILMGMMTAWTQGLTRNPSNKTECSFTGERCQDIKPCCQEVDVCLTRVKLSDSEDEEQISTCENRKNKREISTQLKPARETLQTVSKNQKLAYGDACANGFIPDVPAHEIPADSGDRRSTGVEECSNSAECADSCCREVRGHRTRYRVCGTPVDEFKTYTCIN